MCEWFQRSRQAHLEEVYRGAERGMLSATLKRPSPTVCPTDLPYPKPDAALETVVPNPHLTKKPMTYPKDISVKGVNKKQDSMFREETLFGECVLRVQEDETTRLQDLQKKYYQDYFSQIV